MIYSFTRDTASIFSILLEFQCELYFAIKSTRQQLGIDIGPALINILIY